MQKIAILNTGSELITGDILNTNGQYAASLLQDHGFSIGMHILVTDEQPQIEQALEFLLQHHAVIITTGGLGPTSDDLTRFALAETFKVPLIFYPESWQRIQAHFKKLERDCPDNNRIQALFPEHALIFPNAHGTADGCGVSRNGQWVYLLPGPPREFKPMLNQFVLPHLLHSQPHQTLFRASWLLLNASESHIAQRLDPLIPKMPAAELAYCVFYPYLEVKLRSADHAAFLTYCTQIEPHLQPFLVSQQKENASEQLKHYIQHFQPQLVIQDGATGGLLEARLLDIETYPYLQFSKKSKKNDQAFYVKIEGLQAFWEHADHPTTLADVRLSIEYNHHTDHLEAQVRVYSNDPRLYAAETCAWLLLSYLKEHTYGS